MKMKFPFKYYYNYAVDLVLLYGFIAITVSSFILWFILPMGQGLGGDLAHFCPHRFTGRGGAGNLTHALGLPRFEWVEIHAWICVVVSCIVLLHLFLHWKWIIDTTKRIKYNALNFKKAHLERYVTTFTLFVLAAFEILSGFVLWLIMPRGVGDLLQTQSGVGRTFWGLQRNVWVDLHAWVAVFMLAIIVVHIIIHWQWIVNMTIGKLKSDKANGAIESEITHQLYKSIASDNNNKQDYLQRVGMLIGLVGSIGFLVSMFTFQLDWNNRYGFMLYFIPVPFILLILARKWSLIGGSLLIILGIMSIVMYFIFPIGIVWNQIGVWNVLGWETVYTLVFVTLPLLSAGILILLSAILNNKRKFLS